MGIRTDGAIDIARPGLEIPTALGKSTAAILGISSRILVQVWQAPCTRITKEVAF